MNWLGGMGVEFPILKWMEPRAVAHLNWQSENWLICKKFIVLFLKFGIAIGLPFWVATKIWLPEGFSAIIIGLLVIFGFCCLLPIIAFLQDWAISKAGIVCAINKKGLVKNGASYEWKNIISYRFYGHPDLENVRVLSTKVHDTSGECERKFYFNPNEVSETKIRELIKPHLTQ